jgi:hypothetical protein
MDSQDVAAKPRTKSKSFASILKYGGNMSSGILKHVETLSPKGLTEASSQQIEALVEECKQMDNEQEIFKGELKEKTSKLHAKVQELLDALGLSSAIVKRVMPRERWVDFGISAKK